MFRLHRWCLRAAPIVNNWPAHRCPLRSRPSSAVLVAPCAFAQPSGDGKNERGAPLGRPALQIVGKLFVGHGKDSFTITQGCLIAGPAFKGSSIVRKATARGPFRSCRQTHPADPESETPLLTRSSLGRICIDSKLRDKGQRFPIGGMME